MELNPRRLRGLTYAMSDLQAALRLAGRDASAESMGEVTRKLDSLSMEQFLDDARTALEAVLLGERDLRPELMGEILQIIAQVDDLLRVVS